MKNQTLSVEQMIHLKSLGVDMRKASMVLIAKDESGNEVCWEDLSFKEDTDTCLCESWDEELEEPCKKEAYLNYFDAETGDYDHSYRKDCGVFTLQDIIELLPKYIKTEDGGYSFNDRLFLGVNDIDEYILEYIGISAVKKAFASKSLLDTAYQMLCWCAENGYLNNNKTE